MRNKLCILPLILTIIGCKCPELLAPKIIVNSSKPNLGSKLILTTNHFKNASVYWTGPIGSHIGEAWIIDSVTKEMSGSYSANYIYKNCKHCKSEITTQVIEVYPGPNLPTPKIYANKTELTQDSTLILSVRPIENTLVEWAGPLGNYYENPLIIDSVKKQMTGYYSAKYIFPSIKGVMSKESKKFVTIYNRTIKLKLKDSTYYLDFVSTNNSTTIWARASKFLNKPGQDFPVAEIEINSGISEKEAKSTFCKYADLYDKYKTFAGCTVTAGVAGCALAIPYTGGLAAPFCTVYIESSEFAIAACAQGVAEIIAAQLEKELPFTLTAFTVGVLKQDKLSLVENTVSLACLSKQNKIPIMVDGHIIEAPKAAVATTATSNNNHAGNGHTNQKDGLGGHSGEGSGGGSGNSGGHSGAGLGGMAKDGGNSGDHLKEIPDRVGGGHELLIDSVKKHPSPPR